MTKSSILCSSCGVDNDPDAEFCINCGTAYGNKTGIEKPIKKKMTDKEKQEKSYQEWKRSVPYTAAVCVFLLIIDYMTGSGIQWAWWPVIPIILFAIIAPYFSYKMG
jgi:uncharacterized membrane protein YvbJ